MGKRRPFHVVPGLEVLENRTLLSGENLLAFTFQGPNTAYSAQPGDIGGGYYILDPDRLSQSTSDGARWDLSGLGGVIDDSLADTLEPSHIRGDHVAAFNGEEESGAYIRYGPIGSYDNITIYTQTGPKATAGQTLGSYLASHGVDWLAGNVRYTYIENPTISTFSVNDVFKNPKSLAVPQLSEGGRRSRLSSSHMSRSAGSTSPCG